MKRIATSAGITVLAAAFMCAPERPGSQAQTKEASEAGVAPAREGNAPSYAPAVLKETATVDRARQEQVMTEAARAAWRFIDAHHVPATGFVAAQKDWPYPTLWDVASTMGANYAARELGLLSADEYRQRTSRLLSTLEKARLYKNIAYGRNYSAKTGEMVDDAGKVSATGTGFSALDLGRLLVMLKVVSESDPALAAPAERVVRRIDGSRIIRDGYMHGEQIVKGELKQYQEGRIGYEQYAARGFALWGMNASKALRMEENATKASVLGIPMTGDKRGLDRITSEPLVMMGLEVGWDDAMRELAWQTLSAQAQRYVKTGTITIASEDAIAQPPHYFYYYCVYCSGREFVINVHTPGVQLDAPRWVSSKAAFGWHALLPSKYTWNAVETVLPAKNPQRGWASGVYENSGKSTETYSLNTAAIILESVLYFKRGKPMVSL